MTRICGATKRNGERCVLPVHGQSDVCWAHDPVNAERRRRTASKGGRASASSVSRELHGQLVELAQQVADGKLAPYKGAVVCQLVNARIRLLEVERRAAEAEEFEERLAALERSRGGGGRGVMGWGV